MSLFTRCPSYRGSSQVRRESTVTLLLNEHLANDVTQIGSSSKPPSDVGWTHTYFQILYTKVFVALFFLTTKQPANDLIDKNV